jgi:cytidine deaminase
VKAVSEGKRAFTRLAVAARSSDFCTPCGICRQMLYEFAPDLTVLCAARTELEAHTLRDLLAHGFGPEGLIGMGETGERGCGEKG